MDEVVIQMNNWEYWTKPTVPLVTVNSDITTVSYIGWIVTYNNKDDKFCVPEYLGNERLLDEEYKLYVDDMKRTFVNLIKGCQLCSRRECCPTLDIGLLNEDGTCGYYATVWLNKDNHYIRVLPAFDVLSYPN